MSNTLINFYLQQSRMHEEFLTTLLNHAKDTNDSTLRMLVSVHMVELSELLNTVPELELPERAPMNDHTDIEQDRQWMASANVIPVN